jgi:hypothetical protein
MIENALRRLAFLVGGGGMSSQSVDMPKRRSIRQRGSAPAYASA